MCYCDYEEPEFFSEVMRKARKQHKCDECWGVIEIGQSYKVIAGVWGGDFSRYKHCNKCLSLIEFMKAHVKCFCWSFTDLISSAAETVSGIGNEASSIVFPVYRHVIRRKKNILAYRKAKNAKN